MILSGLSHIYVIYKLTYKMWILYQLRVPRQKHFIYLPMVTGIYQKIIIHMRNKITISENYHAKKAYFNLHSTVKENRF